jgi:hypothetical protein
MTALLNGDAVSKASRATHLLGFWFVTSNEMEKCVNYLDPEFPAFRGDRVLDAYVQGVSMIEHAVKFLREFVPLPVDNSHYKFHVSDVDIAVRHEGLVDTDGYGYFCDDDYMWKGITIKPSTFHDLRNAWPCFTHIAWFYHKEVS